MKPPITVTDVARNFSEFINRVVYRGEEFVLERGGKPVARLVPVPEAGRLGDLPRILQEVPGLSAEDADAFAGDFDAARESLPDPTDPWPS